MFERLSNGWELAKRSWRVLLLDKELLIFPFLSGIAFLAVVASFAVPLVGSGYLERVAGQDGVPEDPVAYVILFAFYFATYFVIVFFNSAVVASALHRFHGGDPDVATGLRAAIARLPQIFAWAFVSATVGLMLRAIESRSETVGKLVAGILGIAWGAGTYLVVPVLVAERLGPFSAIRRSLELLRRTWGEALSANFGIGLLVFLLGLGAAVPALLGFVLAGSGVGEGAVVVGVALTVALVLLISMVSAALNGILLGALYEYAARGETPAGFERGILSGAFGAR